MALSAFFLDPATHGASLVDGSHHAGLVLLSLCVSIFTATMALQTAHIARRARRAMHYYAAILSGALALGGGIWATHFIGMLAHQLPVPVSYSAPLTMLSLLPAFAASGFALRMLAMSRVTPRHMLFGGTLVGLGIGAMHYSGMAAMRVPLEMHYDSLLFGLSILIAIALSILALWMGYGLERTKLPPYVRTGGSGAVLGMAIAGMHYTGMAAVRFTGQAQPTHNEVVVSTLTVALMLAGLAIMLTVLVVAINGLIRVQELYRSVREGSVRLRAILDTAVDGIITIDAKGLIQDFNQSAERLFGWTAQEVKGRNIKMLMPEPYQSAHDGYLKNYQESGQPKIIGIGREVVGLRKDGSHMPMRLAVGRVDLPGELLFVGFVTDISDRHALEASLREAAEQAEQAVAAKSTFLANMSHEIRTPMNSIIGFTELLLQTRLDETQRGHLETVRQASSSLLRLINDILDTTKLEKGQFELEFSDFSLKAVAMQVESSMRLSAHEKHLSFRVQYPDDMPEYFKGDPLRVLQILNNLVGNAIKFTLKGGVELVFAHRPGAVHIQVRDTGIGMSSEQVEIVFAPFAQADASISRRFGGTGLGTTIARQLAEQMGGSIAVESALGFGTTFHVHLPLILGKRPIKSPAPQPAAISIPPQHVLIADDVPQNLELLTLILEREGHTVRMAHNGREALKAFKENSFGLVLMDVHMPELDGLQACRLIREYERDHRRERTPVIALTASVMAEDRRAASLAGMDGFAVKPLDAPQLLSEMSRVLKLVPEATAEPLDSDPQANEAGLIDWERGLALWGEKDRLLEALTRFFASVETKYPLSESDDAADTKQRLIFSLHGIRGAAGNLAMPDLARQAGALESRLREGQAPEREELDALMSLVQCYRAEVNAVRAAEVSEDTSAGRDRPEIFPDLPATARRLLAVLRRQELDDDLLAAVREELERQGEHARSLALWNAVDGFEFGKAVEILEDLMVNAGEV